MVPFQGSLTRRILANELLCELWTKVWKAAKRAQSSYRATRFKRAKELSEVSLSLTNSRKYSRSDESLSRAKPRTATFDHEAGLLKLNCDKALALLKWQAALDYQDTIKFTSEWYYDHYKNNGDMMTKTIKQIGEYEEIAKSKSLKWTA